MINGSLPTEIFTEIFSHVLGTPQNFDLQYNHSRSTLCTVCKHWSEVMVNYPRFWSMVFLRLETCPRITPSALNTLLRRSVNMPIEIYVTDLGEVMVPMTEELVRSRREIFLPLRQHLSRWKKLALRSQPLFAAFLRGVDFSQAPLLEEVSLYFGHATLNLCRYICLGLREAPALSFLALPPLSLNLLDLLYGPGAALLQRLKRLDGPHAVPPLKLLETIHCCKSANHISIGSRHGYLRDVKSRVSSTKLHILDLTFKSNDLDILGYLDLPNLQVLLIRCTEVGGNSLAHAVSRFIDRDSLRSIWVLKMENMSAEILDTTGLVQSSRRIPVFEVQVQIEPTVLAGELPATLSEDLVRWKEIDSRFRICTGPVVGGMWSIGWIDSQAYKRYQKSLAFDVLGVIHNGLMA